MIAGERVQISCTGPSGVGWSVTTSIPGATLIDDLDADGALSVTWEPSALGA